MTAGKSPLAPKKRGNSETTASTPQPNPMLA